MNEWYVIDRFEQFSKQRADFVLSLSYLVNSTDDVELLERCGTLELIRSLLYDPVPGIHHRALGIVTKMANSDERISEKIVKLGIVSSIVRNMRGTESSVSKSCSMSALHAISQHSMKTAVGVLKGGGLRAITECLKDLNPNVKISAAWTLNNIVQHDSSLALKVVESGVLKYIARNLREAYVSVKVFCALVIATLSKYPADVAEYILNSGCFTRVAKYITHRDAKLRGLSLSTVSNLCLHSVQYVKVLSGPKFVIDIVQSLKHSDQLVKKCSMTIVREISAHSRELTEMVVRRGAIEALLWTIQSSSPCAFRPAISALGNIASLSENEAKRIIKRKGHFVLAVTLHCEKCENVLKTTAWAIGQIGKHSTHLANQIANLDVFPRMVDLYCSKNSSDELKEVLRDALRTLVQMCDDEGALRYFLIIAPQEMMVYCLKQHSIFLRRNKQSRRSFLMANGLRKIQLIDTRVNSVVKEYVNIIKSCFPEEMIKFYSPGFPDTLIKSLDNYVPKVSKEDRSNRPRRGLRKFMYTLNDHRCMKGMPTISDCSSLV